MYRANYLSEGQGSCNHQRFSPAGNFSCPSHRQPGIRMGNPAIGSAQYRNMQHSLLPQSYTDGHGIHHGGQQQLQMHQRRAANTPRLHSLEALGYQPNLNHIHSMHSYEEDDSSMASPVRAFMPQQQQFYSVPETGGGCSVHAYSNPRVSLTPQDIRSMSGVLGSTYIGLEDSTPSLPIRKTLGMIETWLVPPYADVNVDIFTCKQTALADLKRKADLLAQQECTTSTKPGKTAIIHIGSSLCGDGGYILSGTAVLLRDDEINQNDTFTHDQHIDRDIWQLDDDTLSPTPPPPANHYPREKEPPQYG